MTKGKSSKKKSSKQVSKGGIKKALCPVCSSRAKKVGSPYTSTLRDSMSGEFIVVKDSFYLQCIEKECAYTWVPASEVARVEDLVFQKSFNLLTEEQIRILRESLGLANKSIAARLLGLNTKAFVKLERGAGKHNFSTDLLIRLVAHNKENLRFLKDLKKKSYRFDVSDYEMLSKSHGRSWTYEVNPTGYQKWILPLVDSNRDHEKSVFSPAVYDDCENVPQSC